MDALDQDLSGLLTLREAARRLGVHENTVRNWLSTGILTSVRPPGARFHKFDPAEVERVRLARLRPPEPVGDERMIVGPELADATRIGFWADTRDAQAVFPRLVRRLLASTPGVEALKGRAGEGVGFAGWDLQAKVAAATPWLPRGHLVFELGVGRNPRAKADADYLKRTADALEPSNESRMSWFVFATPRRWPGGEAWAAERAADGFWAGVRVLDGDDIEAWLESVPSVHVWLSEQIGLSPHGVESAESWWRAFCSRTRPPLPSGLFLAGRAPERESLLAKLDRGDGPVGVRASWRDDALAFICVALGADDQDVAPARPAVIVHDQKVWRRVVEGPGDTILIPLFAGREAVSVSGGTKRLVVPFGAEDVPNGDVIALPPPDRARASEVFREEGGLDFEDAGRLAALARRSMPALMRRRSANPAFAKPAWGHLPWSAIFAPLVLAGSWSESGADRQLIAELVGREWAEIERALRAAADSDDRPFIPSGETWRVASHEEALDVLAMSLTSDDLSRWAEVVTRVLLEKDPLTDLDADERLVASARGVGRTWSGLLRKGLAEGLALMGSHGEMRLAGGATAAEYAESVVRVVLAKADDDRTGARWRSLADDLPLIAEAAPNVFLERVLRASSGSSPLLRSMFMDGAENTGWAISSPHSALLWALETLCWSRDYLLDGTRALAQLAAIDPGGRLGNRPGESLAAILVPWVRQTSSPLDLRLTAITQIVDGFDEVGWRLLGALWPKHHATIGVPSTPRFRDWKPDHKGVPLPEWLAVVDHVVTCAVRLARLEPERWAVLLTRLGPLPAQQRDRLIHEFESRAEDLVVHRTDQLELWETLTSEIERHRTFATADWAMETSVLDRLQSLADRIEPHHSVERFARLFDWRPDIGTVKRQNYEERQAELDSLRTEAIRKTVEADGIDGLARLALRARVPRHVGWSLGVAFGDTYCQALLEWLAAPDRRRDAAAAWVNQRALTQGIGWVAQALRNAPDDNARLVIARQARAEPALWEHLDASWPDLAESYWASVEPWVAPADVASASRRLLAQSRPFVAINVIATALHARARREDVVDAELVAAVLTAALTTTEDLPSGGDMLGYEIGELIDYLERANVSDETLAGFELAFFRTLEEHRQPRALYAVLGTKPEVFVELVSRLYHPKSGPRRAPDRGAEAAAELAWHVLHEWRTVPGLREDGTIDADRLHRWVDSARLALRDADRADVGDQQIGQILAGSPPGSDGAWPAEPVRDLIERLGSHELENGVHIGKVNLRGVTTRGVYEGGAQERALAAQFEDWSATTAGRWPRTSRLLKELAESYERDAAREDLAAQQDADAG